MLDDTEARQQWLKKTYSFDCACALCTAPPQGCPELAEPTTKVQSVPLIHVWKLVQKPTSWCEGSMSAFAACTSAEASSSPFAVQTHQRVCAAHAACRNRLSLCPEPLGSSDGAELRSGDAENPRRGFCDLDTQLYKASLSRRLYNQVAGREHCRTLRDSLSRQNGVPPLPVPAYFSECAHAPESPATLRLDHFAT